MENVSRRGLLRNGSLAVMGVSLVGAVPAFSAGLAPKAVAAVGPMLGLHEPRLAQLLQDLRQQRQRNPVGIGDLVGARTPLTLDRKVLQGYEPVVGFLSELEHGFPTV